MNKEMKMGDYFNLPVSDDFIGRMDHSQCVKFVSDGVNEFEAAIHAINNHDTLTEQVKQLRDGLKKVSDELSWYLNKEDAMIRRVNDGNDSYQIKSESLALAKQLLEAAK